MGLDDVVDVRETGLGLALRKDLVMSEHDYGLGKEVTGLVDSTLIAVGGALIAGTNTFNSNIAYSLYDAINSMAAVPSDVLYNFFLPWAAFGTGIGYVLAETQKQKIIPGVALAGLAIYSTYETMAAMSVPASYLFASAGLATTVLASALPPVFALFGLGWAIGAAYMRIFKRKRGRRKGKKK